MNQSKRYEQLCHELGEIQDGVDPNDHDLHWSDLLLNTSDCKTPQDTGAESASKIITGGRNINPISRNLQKSSAKSFTSAMTLSRQKIRDKMGPSEFDEYIQNKRLDILFTDVQGKLLLFLTL